MDESDESRGSIGHAPSACSDLSFRVRLISESDEASSDLTETTKELTLARRLTLDARVASPDTCDIDVRYRRSRPR